MDVESRVFLQSRPAHRAKPKLSRKSYHSGRFDSAIFSTRSCRMSRVATCPQCAAQLAVPDLATSGSRASCPYCNTEFALAGAIRELRSLSLVEPQSESD